MSWADDIKTAWLAWLGATPPPSDAEATRALELALATVETWLDRPLELIERVQEDWPAYGVVRLRAWPVETLTSIDANGHAIDLATVKLDKRTGRLLAPACSYTLTTTTYTGGFDPFPADLELALWMVAASLLPAVQSAGGAAVGDAVRRVTTPDVGTVEYATGPAGDAQAAELLGGTLSPQVESLLARYRAEGPIGGA